VEIVEVESWDSDGASAESDSKEPRNAIVELHGPSAFVTTVIEVQAAAEGKFHSCF
jgi:hypothetical protein